MIWSMRITDPVPYVRSPVVRAQCRPRARVLLQHHRLRPLTSKKSEKRRSRSQGKTTTSMITTSPEPMLIGNRKRKIKIGTALYQTLVCIDTPELKLR